MFDLTGGVQYTKLLVPLKQGLALRFHPRGPKRSLDIIILVVKISISGYFTYYSDRTCKIWKQPVRCTGKKKILQVSLCIKA